MVPTGLFCAYLVVDVLEEAEDLVLQVDLEGQLHQNTAHGQPYQHALQGQWYGCVRTAVRTSLLGAVGGNGAENQKQPGFAPHTKHHQHNVLQMVIIFSLCE